MRKNLQALCLVFPFAALPSVALSDVIRIEARNGAPLDVHFGEAESPSAAIIMFEGSGGNFSPGDRGFIASRYDDFVDAGFTVAVVTPPSDQRSFQGGMHPRFREGPAHAQDIEAVVKMLQERTRLPV